MIKLTALLIRRPEVSREEFNRHWVEIHAPLVNALPGARRYVQSHIIAEQGTDLVPSIGAHLDGIAELWFDDRAAMETAFGTPAAEQLAADGAHSSAKISFFVAEEKVFISVPTDAA
jgi:uncharacterized protein (TIGR02118 family)